MCKVRGKAQASQGVLQYIGCTACTGIKVFFSNLRRPKMRKFGLTNTSLYRKVTMFPSVSMEWDEATYRSAWWT